MSSSVFLALLCLGLVSLSVADRKSPYGPGDTSYGEKTSTAKVHGQSKGMQCFQCTSYAEGCGETVNKTAHQMPQGVCPNGCFVRQGYEDKHRYYRGCVDDYIGVDYLSNYLKHEGCHDIKWHNEKVSRMWCVCKDNDLCNQQSVDFLHHKYGTKHIRAKSADLSSATDDYYTEDTYNYVHQGDKEQEDKQDDTSNSNNNNNHVGYFPESTYEEVDSGYGRQANIEAKDSAAEVSKDGENKQGQSESMPYQEKHQRVYTDVEVEQVHYGDGTDSTDIFVKSPQEKDNYGGYYDSYDEPEPEVEKKDSISQLPYYPYEGQDAAYKEQKQDSYYSDGYYDNRGGYDAYEQQPEPKQADTQHDYYTEDKHQTIEAVSDKEEKLQTPEKKKLLCSKNGFIPNPEDCSKFLACIMDPNVNKPVMYAMRCPQELYWDNTIRNCVSHSTTCHVKKVHKVRTHIPYVNQYANDEYANSYADDNQNSFEPYR